MGARCPTSSPGRKAPRQTHPVAGRIRESDFMLILYKLDANHMQI